MSQRFGQHTCEDADDQGGAEVEDRKNGDIRRRPIPEEPIEVDAKTGGETNVDAKNNASEEQDEPLDL